MTAKTWRWSYVVVYAVIGDETQTHVHTQMHTETPSLVPSALLGDPGAHSRSACRTHR